MNIDGSRLLPVLVFEVLVVHELVPMRMMMMTMTMMMQFDV